MNHWLSALRWPDLSVVPITTDCPVCGRRMTLVRSVALTGEQFCDRHQADPQCCLCALPAQPDCGYAVPLCRRCALSAVRSQADVKRVLPPIARGIRALGIRTSPPVRVRLCDPIELHGQPGQPGHALGATRSVGSTVIDLSVVRDLPQVMLGTTVAHEVMHAYLTQQRFPFLRPDLAEGLCELTAYAWARRQPGALAAAARRRIDENRDPVYGEGFRAVKRVVERAGIEATLSHVKEHGELPPPYP